MTIQAANWACATVAKELPCLPRCGRLFQFAASWLSIVVFASPIVVHAELLVFESFDYPTGDLNGKQGGSGFSSPWSSSNEPDAITSDSAGLMCKGFFSAGNKASLDAQRSRGDAKMVYARRSLPRTLGQPDTTTYIAYLIHPRAGERFLGLLLYRDGVEQGFFGRGTSDTHWRFTAFRKMLRSDSRIAYERTTLLVLRLDATEGRQNDKIRLYVNPDPAHPEPAVEAFTGIDLQFNEIAIGAGVGQGHNSPRSANGSIDEIRIGTTWRSVLRAPPALKPTGPGLLLIGAGSKALWGNDWPAPQNLNHVL